jgi:hypothetical protein
MTRPHFMTTKDFIAMDEKIANKICPRRDPKKESKVKKKSPKYMMISGWLPISSSHYKIYLPCEDVTSEQKYSACKMVADMLNDGISERKIKKIVAETLKDSDLARFRPVAFDYFVETVYSFISEYYEIYKYYKEFHNA